VGDFASIRRGLQGMIDVLHAIDRPVLLVPGNSETDDALRAACAGWPAARIASSTRLPSADGRRSHERPIKMRSRAAGPLQGYRPCERGSVDALVTTCRGNGVGRGMGPLSLRALRGALLALAILAGPAAGRPPDPNPAPPPAADGERIAAAFAQLTRGTSWQLVSKVPLKFDAHHPESAITSSCPPSR
jgi:hypothetical protein